MISMSEGTANRQYMGDERAIKALHGIHYNLILDMTVTRYSVTADTPYNGHRLISVTMRL
jgi:hypothetical protein